MGGTLDRVREQLAQVLIEHWHGQESSLTDAEATRLCERVGIFPLPPPSARARALAIYAERVLPLFSSESPQADEIDRHNFLRWCEAVDAGEDGVRAGSVLLRLWSYEDSRALGAH